MQYFGVSPKCRKTNKSIKMRVILIVFTVFTIVIVNNVEGKMNLEALKKSVKPFRPVCMKATGVTDEVVDGVHRGEFPPERELMCYFKCLYQKMKGIRDGKLAIDMLRAQTKALLEDSLSNRMLEMSEKCGHLATHEDVCQAAYDYTKCCYETDSSVDFFP